MASNSVFSLVPGLVVAGMEGQVATERFVRSIAVCVLDEALPPDHDFDLDVALAAIGVFQRAALTTIAHLAALRACVEGRRDASRRLSDDACVLSSLRAFVASEADYLVFNARSSVVSDPRFVRAVSGATVEMDQWVRRGDEVLVRMDITIACINARGRATRLPADIARAFESFASGIIP